jgi:peptidoglycan/xylan/chitin deacetylase (PgdA/CDA1 family)
MLTDVMPVPKSCSVSILIPFHLKSKTIQARRDPLVFSLRIDIDTFDGLRRGVPQILDILNHFDMRASFYCIMGREGDIVNNLKHKVRSERILMKGAAKEEYKQLRDTVQQFSMRASLSQAANGLFSNPLAFFNEGTRLSKRLFFPQRVSSAMSILKRIADEKHEIGPHGYIHIKWSGITPKEMREEFEAMISEYVHIFQTYPRSWCAPFGTLNQDVIRLTEEARMEVNSYLNGSEIFHPSIDGRKCRHVMVPVTTCATTTIGGIKRHMPLLQYFKSIGISDWTSLKHSTQLIDEAVTRHGWASTFVHAEFEGMKRPNLFTQLIKFVKRKGYATKTFLEVGNSFRKHSKIEETTN